ILPREFGRVIFHVDMDSFYASCELSNRPELRNVPFVVGADPKDGKGRGVVLACNYPARKFGLHSGMPISRAWQLCPQAHYDFPHFELYEQVSLRVMKIIQSLADKVEQISIDEAFLEVTNRIEMIMENGHGSSDVSAIQSLADSIRKNISDKENITCSVGVSDSKIIAKIATDMSKPNGLTIVLPSKAQEFLAPLEVSKIPGVGPVSQKILLDNFRVKTISDLRGVPLEDLKASFGKSAFWLSNVANGIDRSAVLERWAPVSLSSETTFFEDETDYSKVMKSMHEIAKEVHSRTVKDGFLFRRVSIKIRFSGFETHTRSRSLTAHTDSLTVLKREAEMLLSQFLGSEKKVRLIGVKVSNLLKKEKTQRTLLDWDTT
ncbi:MAG TPA: DNA polymerase IV, partial [Nitrososphaerales archaeon]|nr:DNA polymerase IV [Nitrososphaerales archaeon]